MNARRLVVATAVAVAMTIGATRPGVGAAPLREEAAPRPAISHAAIDSSLARARRWLDTLEVDCAALDRAGLNGKKRLAEILEAYLDCRLATGESLGQRAILERVTRLTAQTRDNAYHDLASYSDAEFKANSLSYLRVAWLMSRFGLDVEDYRRRVRAILPRMDAQMAARGAWQRSMFAHYLAVLGLRASRNAEPDPLRHGVIAHRLPLDRLDRGRAYDLTHEVFAVFEADSAGALARFGPGDREYLNATLPVLAATEMARGNTDLAAELLTCMALTGAAGDPRLRAGIGWLIAAQNPDGSWDRERGARAVRSSWIPLRDQLHTTMVANEALYEARQAGVEPATETPAR